MLKIQTPRTQFSKKDEKATIYMIIECKTDEYDEISKFTEIKFMNNNQM